MPTPTEILESAILKAVCTDRFKKGRSHSHPGAVILSMSADSREALARLKSDDLRFQWALTEDDQATFDRKELSKLLMKHDMTLK